jgi:hypothetical protein
MLIIPAIPAAKFDQNRGDRIGEQQEQQRRRGAADDAEIEQRLRGHAAQPPAVDHRAGDPPGRRDRAEKTDELLREMQLVGHVIIERRAEAGIEVVEKQEPADQPQLAPAQAGQERTERDLQLRQIGAAALLLDQKQRAENRQKRRDSDNQRRAMQRAFRR